jgi:hypothetical protein
MRGFSRVPVPHGWENDGLKAGTDWLREHPQADRPRDLWSRYRPYLAAGFAELCGYTVMYTPNGTVDHFVPWADIRGTADAWRAYEWGNFRYCAGWFNSARRGPIPDPFVVEDSWFELRLPSLELVATAAVPTAERAAVDNVLRWLRDDDRVLKQRAEWFRMYREAGLSLAELARKAPLIAAALRRQPEFLLPDDQIRPRAGAP